MIPNFSLNSSQSFPQDNTPLQIEGKTANMPSTEPIIDFKATLSIAEESDGKAKRKFEDRELVCITNKKPKRQEVASTQISIEDSSKILKRNFENSEVSFIVHKKTKIESFENKENIEESNQKHGLVTTNCDNGNVEVVTYNMGVKEGPAKRTNTNGDVLEFTFVNGKEEGPAKETFVNGDVLDFAFVSGKEEGPAKETFVNGDFIEFAFVNGVKEGAAKRTYVNGDVLETAYVNGKQNNLKKITYANKNVLEFTSINGIKEGPAKYTCVNGDFLEFTYVNGIKEGAAKRTYVNGDVLETAYVNGKQNNLKKITYANKNVLEFTLINGKHEGPAKETLPNGVLIEYTFVNGIKEGPAKETFPNGDFVEYAFVNDIKEGAAKKTYSNGDILDFIFVQNVKKGPIQYTTFNGDVLAPTFINGLEDNDLAIKDYLLNLLFVIGNHPDIHILEKNIKEIDSGTRSIIFNNRVVFLSKLSKNDPLCLGVVNLLEKSFAKGGLGKLYKVHSEMELVFKLSRKKLKSKNQKGEKIPLDINEKILKAEKGTTKGLLAKNDLINEYNMIQFIKENALDRTGLGCDAFSLVSYKNQMGVFLKKFDFDGFKYLVNNPTFESRFSIMTQTLRGLKTLHDLKIIHRDLKLENILIKNKVGFPLEAAISDFGSASHAKDLFTANNSRPDMSVILGCGTPRCTSDLIVHEIKGKCDSLKRMRFGSRNYTKTSEEIVDLLKKSDLFSFSILAYQLITLGGPLPFKSFQTGKYLSFDKDQTASEQLKCFDLMRGNLSNAFKNSKFDEDEAIKNIEMIMSNFERGLKVQHS